MSATREFFETWVQKMWALLLVEKKPVSPCLPSKLSRMPRRLVMGARVREDELGNNEDAIEQAMSNVRLGVQTVSPEKSSPEAVMDALQVDDAKSGPWAFHRYRYH